MLKLYDKNHNAVGHINQHKNLKIESDVSTGDKTLSFMYLGNLEIFPEYYLETDTDEYVIKEKQESLNGFPQFIATLNLEELEGKPWGSFSVKDATIDEAAKLALAGTGWTVGECTVKKRRNAGMLQVSTKGIIDKLKTAFLCEVQYDTKHKKVSFYTEVGEDKGAYFIKGLNLKKLTKKADSYDYYTRIIPIGENGLTIETVNDGKNYLENYQYSNKEKTYIWKDESYTDAEALKEDGELKLRDLSRPVESYSVTVSDLAKQKPEYSVLSYGLGDRIYLTDSSTRTRTKQRIVKMTVYPQSPDKNTCEIANTVLTFEELQQKYKEASDIVNTVISGNGQYTGTINVSDILNFEQGLTDSDTVGGLLSGVDNLNNSLKEVSLKVGTIETNYIKTEEADLKYATIENLDAAAAEFHSLESDYGEFKDLTADRLNAGSAAIEELEAEKLSAEDADIRYAKIDFANIGAAAIEKLFSDSGIIKDLVVSEGHITGELVGVTIKGDLIEGDTIVADKLVIKGSDGLYYKLNTNGETVESEQTDYNSLNGKIITAKSVTAEKIYVDDLSAFGATIGGFRITSDSIHSNLKESVHNHTQGVYMDDEGQFAVGDGQSCIKYYEGDDGKRHLMIVTDELITSSGGRVIEEIDGIKSDLLETEEQIEEAKTQITQNKQSIELKAEAIETELEEAKKQIVEAEAAIKVNADGISSVAQRAAENKTAISEVQQEAENLKVNIKSIEDGLIEAETTIAANSAGLEAVVEQSNDNKKDITQLKLTASGFEVSLNSAMKSTEEQFYLSSSPTTLSGGSWSASQPTWTQGKYIWRRTLVTYADGSTEYTPSQTGVCITGNTGATGATGAKGDKGDTGATGAKGDKGDKGDTGATGAAGNGISSIAEHYAVSSSNTTAPTSWSSTPPTMTATNKYLWNYETITYTNGTTSDTAKRVIGAYGDKGATGATGATGAAGAAGAAGKGISKITNYYLASASASGVTTSTSGWTTTIQTISTSKKYLWNYEVITYTDNTTATTTPCIIGAYGNTGATGAKGDKGDTGATGAKGDKGDKGDTGATGAAGKGISSVVNYYLASASASGVTTSTSGWTTTIQTISTSKKYLWNYEKITYTDNTTSSTTPCIIGVYGNTGATGATGAAGKGISSITEYYLASASASGVTTSTSGWTTTMQTTTTTKKYLWNYEKITYTDGTTSNTTVRIIGTHGATGATGAKGDKGDTGATGAAGKDGQMLYATCATAAATAAKVATLSAGTLKLAEGAAVSVKFTNANSVSSPTLNVGGTGAKTIRVNGAAMTSSAYYWSAGAVVTFIYDGSYWNVSDAGALKKADDAAKTATNYLGFDSNGLVVGDRTASTLGKNVLIDSDGVDIRDGSTVLASFEKDTIELGNNSKEAVVSMCGSMGRVKTAIHENTEEIYKDGIILEGNSAYAHGEQYVNILAAPSLESVEGYGFFADTTGGWAGLYATLANSAGTDVLRQALLTLEANEWNGNSSAELDADVIKLNASKCLKMADCNYLNKSSNSAIKSVQFRFSGNAPSQDLSFVGYDAEYEYGGNAKYFNSVMSSDGTMSSGVGFKSNSIIDNFKNKVLWSGAYWPSASHTCTFSSAVSAQPHGILLVFSAYVDGAAANYRFHCFYVPKQVVASHNNGGHCFTMVSSLAASVATKYIYITNTNLKGHDDNTKTSTGSSGIKYTNNAYVLRYVIGV